MFTDSKKQNFISVLKLLTTGDKVLVVMLICLGIFSTFFFNIKRLPGEMCSVEVSGKNTNQLKLSENQIFSVTGPRGKTLIQIMDNKVRVTNSACREKICVRSGWINKTGQIIVCVPNRVVVKIDGVNNDFFNVITQ
jgi:hypothetical protein